MYKKVSHGVLKHFDFALWDILCLQLSLFGAYLLFTEEKNPFLQMDYRSMAIQIGLVGLVVMFCNDTLKSVLKRGYYEEFKVTLRHVLYVVAVSVVIGFMLKTTTITFSRRIFFGTFAIYGMLTYIVRCLWKRVLVKKMHGDGEKSLLIVTNKNDAKKVIANIRNNNYARFHLSGIVILDEDMTGKKLSGVEVVSSAANAPMYVCQMWIDEVLVVPASNTEVPEELVEKFMETGVTVHVSLNNISNAPGKKQIVEKVANYTVLTTTMNYATPMQLLVKRLIDICGGLVGCLFTVIIMIFVGPAIYIASPGPIFFGQERVGKNGKTFKMYKFRSMYMDAEERKAELMAQNKISDAKMFKMDFDPRVIGNKILPDGKKKTGIGQFIRDTSLDEFPQFFNVLKGDMSIVGTRPPLMSEVSLYELHHRARLAIKPGITGMWQVSGRSDITDFEKVVELDREYINNWNLGLDLKILFKTVLVVFKKDGSM